MRLPTFQTSPPTWRRLFNRTKKQNTQRQSEILSFSYSSTNLGSPPVISGPTPSLAQPTIVEEPTSTYHHPMMEATPRASSEYADSVTGGLPDEIEYLQDGQNAYPDSPVSLTSTNGTSSMGYWMTHRRIDSGASSIPESMTTASTISSHSPDLDSYNYARSMYHPSSDRPTSFYASSSSYRPQTASIVSSTPRGFMRSAKRDEMLVLTGTSKYPTGDAAERYSPVDVSMPGNGLGGMGRRRWGSKRMSFFV